MSALIHSSYMLLLIRAYSHGDFAQVYPLSRGSAPLLTALLGFWDWDWNAAPANSASAGEH
jgi:hypothetical protein